MVCEPALHPTPGAVTLLFPVADAALDCADPPGLVAETRDLPLVYLGNQYDGTRRSTVLRPGRQRASAVGRRQVDANTALAPT